MGKYLPYDYDRHVVVVFIVLFMFICEGSTTDKLCLVGFYM